MKRQPHHMVWLLKYKEEINSMEIIKLRTNHLENPIGYNLERFSLSWIVKCEGTYQKASRVEVSESEQFETLISDSGWKRLDNLSYIPLDEKGDFLKLKPMTRYYWRVSVKSDNEEEATSCTAFFETAKNGIEWDAKWICAPFSEHPIFRGRFFAHSGQKIRLYMCGVGLYEVYCNGKKITEEVLLPGYHSYDLQLMYQTFVLDSLIQDGENEVTVMLGKGWYMGRFGFGGGVSDIYGDQMTFLCEIYADDQKVLESDDRWECRKSPVVDSNIYDGEIWDARLEDDGQWEKVHFLSKEKASAMKKRLTERRNPKTKVIDHIRPKEIIYTEKGDTVLDFDQNMAGWFTFYCKESYGKEVTVECGEIMQNGEFYRENLRTAQAKLTYVSNGKNRVVRPHFTFYGFRYLRVQGLKNVEEADFCAHVISSVSERTGEWETSNPKVNRLIENSCWGQLGNFIEVPTDCPQRDERMGWTGDAQIFSATACYQYDSSAFYTKFIHDMWLEQKEIGGSVPFVIPSPKVNLMPGARQSSGSCAWSDAATILPWTLYWYYGDRSLLEEEYQGMKAWVDFIRTQETEEHLWQSGFHFADWLALDNPNPGPAGKTDPFYCASAYYYYASVLTAKAAQILGNKEDAIFYQKLANQIKEAFQKSYFTEEGRCLVDTQTAYVLALMFELCREEDREKVAEQLHKKLLKNKMHLDTGFVGTGYLCKALAKVGLQKDAVTLLLQEDMPGWLYQVIMGATTIWERWNSILPDGTINPEGMNSFNHYANGAVCQWIYEDLIGIAPMEAGFKKVLFAPKPDIRLEYARGTFESAMGTYQCSWKFVEGMCHYSLTIPFDCTAKIVIEGCDMGEYTSGTYQFEGGKWK